MAFPTAHHGVPKIAVTGIYAVLSDGPPDGDAAGRHIWANATLEMKLHIVEWTVKADLPTAQW